MFKLKLALSILFETLIAQNHRIWNDSKSTLLLFWYQELCPKENVPITRSSSSDGALTIFFCVKSSCLNHINWFRLCANNSSSRDLPNWKRKLHTQSSVFRNIAIKYQVKCYWFYSVPPPSFQTVFRGEKLCVCLQKLGSESKQEQLFLFFNSNKVRELKWVTFGSEYT